MENRSCDGKEIKMSEKISSFKDLRVYKLAFEVQQEIFETSKRFPTEERYSLTDQIRRASRSIGANLAEAWLRPVDEKRCSTFMPSKV